MSKFEQKHVHDVYSTIVDHFSHTRYRGWPKIEKYLQNLSAGLSVLDIACGNGKYMGYNKQCQFTGIDMCNGLLQICRKRGYNVVQGDMTCLPFLQGTFDQFICIAALHHLSTVERRLQALQEMVRILKKGGRGLIYVWSFEHGGQKKGKSIVKMDTQDSLIEWNDSNGQFITHRYYYMFKCGEIEDLLSHISEVKIIYSGLDCQNWVVEILKI